DLPLERGGDLLVVGEGRRAGVRREVRDTLVHLLNRHAVDTVCRGESPLGALLLPYPFDVIVFAEDRRDSRIVDAPRGLPGRRDRRKLVRHGVTKLDALDGVLPVLRSRQRSKLPV